LIALPLAAQPVRPPPGDELLHLLVFGIGADEIRLASYPPAVRAELVPYLSRFRAYRSKRTGLAKTGEFGMVYTAWTGYERRLAAVSADPGAPALALAYVSELRPCYEWEGLHNGPEREAQFAMKHRADHPNGPFSAYLPLLAAHRWLCAAEGYDYERQPGEATRCRKESGQALSTALTSASLLVRSAAQTLKSLDACHGPPR